MPDLDRSGLSEEFDIEETEIEIEQFKEVLDKVKEIESPNKVLSATIEKAGRFLDIVEREMVNGNVSARMAEVASNLLNSLTTAANSVATINSTWFENNLKEVRIKQRDRELEQKDVELEIKKMYYQNKSLENKGTTNNNIVVSSREDIIRFLEGKQKKIREDNNEQTT